MANEPAMRDYHITDAELTVFTQHVCDCMDRDITQFANFGVSSIDVDNLQTLCDAFEIFPTDDIIYAEYLSAVEAKDALIEEMRVELRNMALRVELKWGKSSAKYKGLGISDMSKIPDEAFIQRARNIYGFMDENKVPLATEGLTELMLTDMSAHIEALDDAKREQIDKASYRAEKSVERVTKGNAIYALVTRYCEIGKRIWDGVNYAKYNDYVIYSGGSSGKPGKIQNLVFTNATSRLSWDAAETEILNYQLEVGSDPDHLILVYEDVQTDWGFGQAPGIYYARCRGINDKGNGAWSDVLMFTKSLLSPIITLCQYDQVEHLLTLQINPVIYAESYDLYRSAVPIGNPAGEFVFYQNIINPVLEQEQTSFNLTLYFYAVAKYGSQVSEASNTVSVNVPA